jgi:RNA-directed DNA polymerase
MEGICDPDNIPAALDSVVCYKGAPGVDGITVKQLPGVLRARWPEIEEELLQGRYQPKPARRVQFPKLAGGFRNLGIPTAIDRLIQQAVLRQLQSLWDATFSEHSYGFRPERSAQRWRRRKPASSRAFSSWSTLTWPSFWTMIHTTPHVLKFD